MGMFVHLRLLLRLRYEYFEEGGKLYFECVCVCGGVRARNV